MTEINAPNDYLRLDVRKLQRDGFVTIGQSYTLRWSGRDNDLGSIQVRWESGSVSLSEALRMRMRFRTPLPRH
jgi:hypothetical protein